MNLSSKILAFYKNLQLVDLPEGFDIMRPFGNDDTWKATNRVTVQHSFCHPEALKGGLEG